MAVHESMRLYITPERFFVEPTDSDESEVLIIDRVSQEISLESNQGQIPPGAASKFICGIFGIIRLLAGPYLLLITRRVKVGEIGGQSIWRVADTEVIPYKKTLLHLTETQMNDNKIYLSMLDQMLKADFFYFSTTYDLSHSLQRLSNTSPDFKQLALHERADQRFIWNHHVLRELTQQPELSKYCLPVMHGFVFIKSAIVKGKTFDYALISRRSCLRAGTRYFIRGINSEGHAANFVETEQIVEYEGSMCSFVQTRGSIPMFWSQRPNLKYKPDPVLSTKENQLLGMKTHLDEQIFNYGRLVLVDLIDQKGKELTLGTALADNVRNVHNDNIRLESFDFHKECSKMRWERLNILMDRIEADRKEMGYFMSLREGTVLSQQMGVFRTNCIDCLDRTNVVQSLIARRTLQDQLIVRH
ncbi:phosphatidylinositide phosphatase SAC1 [Lingula anatina]|uniref:Phosphatidylinositol-3-phosphatase SAC1 n=1 Tax=Lingula anatina TaxID=7574 RepID=A0A1S3HT01_LINAN|nr:phosphatidylinositide phosphatase SAC1 [Lingula anatina]|eukprot:XP_013388681.1 phosphatidylinositide phosphatase SAC1 [Lingula anatina]